MKKTPLFIFAALLGSALLLGACGKEDVKEEPKVSEEEKAEADEKAQAEEAQKDLDKQGAVDKSEVTKSDDALKEEFESEEGVTSVSLIITEDAGGFVLLDFKVDEMKEDKAQEIADKFAETLKEKYKDYQIDVQALKNGEVFAKKTME